jgi:spermidine/putrescine transport system permease protein
MNAADPIAPHRTARAAPSWPRAAHAWVLAGPGLVWLGLLVLLPLVGMTLVSFTERGDDGELTARWTLASYRQVAGHGAFGFDPLYARIALRSAAMAAATTALTAAIGMPLAFFLARLPRPAQTIGLALLTIPFWTNLLIRTYGWQLLLTPGAWLSQGASWIGWIGPGQGLYPGLGAVSIGLVCDFLPFMALPLFASAEKLDWSLVEAAHDLGAGRWRAFWHAALPQVRPGLAAGTVLVFLPAIGQFVVPDLLGGGKAALLGSAIQQEFGPGQNWPLGSALAIAMMILTLCGLAVVRSAAREDRS